MMEDSKFVSRDDDQMIGGERSRYFVVEHRERESGTVVSKDEKAELEALFSAVPSSSSEDFKVTEEINSRSSRLKKPCRVFKEEKDENGVRRLPTTAAYVARLREQERRLAMANRAARTPTPLRDLDASALRVRLKEHGFVELAEHLFQDRVNGKMFEFFDKDILENVFDLKQCFKRRDLLAWIRSGTIL